MGASTRHRKAFLGLHPYCAFCGGETPATTVEHCPPRALFQSKQWPEGFEFPACDECNHGTSDKDLLIALLARMDPFSESGNRDGRTLGLARGVNAQYPGLFRRMMPTANEARRRNRAVGVIPRPGQTQQQTGVANVPPEMHDAVCVFARKLAKAIYYMYLRRIFPNEGCLLLHWFSNEHLIRDGRYPVIDLHARLTGEAPVLQRSGTHLNDQFQFKLTCEREGNVFLIQALFGKAFGVVIYGATKPGELEEVVQRLRTDNPDGDAFAILQSTIL